MQKSSSRVPPLIWAILIGLVTLVAINLGLILYCSTQPTLNHAPYNTALLQEHFPDLLLFKDRFLYFHSVRFFTFRGATPFMYPALDAAIYDGFYQVFGAHPVKTFFSFSLGSYLIAAALFARSLRRRGLGWLQSALIPIVVLLCSYPIWFELKQANIEIVVWVLLSSGLALLLAERYNQAALCFSIATAMKIYPVVFLLLLLQRRRYKSIVLGLAVALVFTVVSLWLVCPNLPLSYKGINAGLQLFQDTYVLRLRGESGFDHSLFGMIKAFWIPLPPTATLLIALRTYFVVVALTSCLVYLVRLRKLPLVNQVLGLTIACILLPPTSFEYTLQHLFAPFAMLLLVAVDAQRLKLGTKRFRILVPVFVMLLGAMSQLIVDQRRWGGPSKAILLAALLLITLTVPLGLPVREASDSGILVREWELG